MRKKETRDGFFGYNWKKRVEVTTLTLGIALAGFGIGMFLDKTLGNSKPVLATSLFVISYPVCQFILFKRFIKLKPVATNTLEPVTVKDPAN